MTLPQPLIDLLEGIVPADAAAADAARQRHAALATPPGALGRLEDLGAQLAAIAGRCPPPAVSDPGLVIAAGDHGVHAQDVSPWPQTVTAMMVQTFCGGRATANAFAAAVGARVSVLDVGVATRLEDHPRLRRSNVRAGTRDLSVEPAMTADECVTAILAGSGVAEELISTGVDVLVTGDMGIANTTAAAALIAAFTGRSPIEVTGRGTGIDDLMLARKIEAVAAGVARHAGDDPFATLAGLGGLEHAALVGVILAGGAARVPVLLDGVNAGAAALAAVALAPASRGYLVAGHRSTEPGATAALDHLGLSPLLDLALRLGEGTGALLAVPTIRAAAAALRDVATLDDVLGA
ncbi:MAG: nicotinate-nucleotide--dimethylbenzimidazole phosphoribosyltransferase [Nitriliruptor sp.]|uniref:nicotinate-nucleotide--dimethylbenzimidazole phosphoribosyltransferase n=1 Tax=Nitriliruptor sp. TaxID=2448056 RepID=UPI0034A07C98